MVLKFFKKKKGASTHQAKLKDLPVISPTEERLWAKIINLEDTLSTLDKTKLSDTQKEILRKCIDNIENAKVCIKRKMRKHPHLAWNLLHRVDEYIILLIPDEELYSRGVNVKTFFDVNIKGEKIRTEWLGGADKKGKLTEALEDDIKKNKNLYESRLVIKEALRIVNEQMDRTFWTLSMNTLMTVLSGVLLGSLMFIFWYFCYTTNLEKLGTGTFDSHVVLLTILGIMGAYLSNLLTREGFLFVRGGNFWRYVFYHLLAKPVLSAFAALFIYVLEKSGLIFSIHIVSEGQQAAQTSFPQTIILNVSKDAAGYVYAVIAIVSGFAADKILKRMIDRVLKRLEEKAEKTEETK